MVRLVIGGAIGALIGATFAMMLAPLPGRDTRLRLRTRVSDIQDHVRLRRRRATEVESGSDETLGGQP